MCPWQMLQQMREQMQQLSLIHSEMCISDRLNDDDADLDLRLKRSGQASVMLQLANWPAEVRGFGPIRQQAAEKARQVRQTARAALMA